jgi:hypothetical protein
LVVVADAAEIRRTYFKQQIHLGAVGVLELVDHDVGVLFLERRLQFRLITDGLDGEEDHVVVIVAAAVVEEVLVLAGFVFLVKFIDDGKGLEPLDVLLFDIRAVGLGLLRDRGELRRGDTLAP